MTLRQIALLNVNVFIAASFASGTMFGKAINILFAFVWIAAVLLSE